MSNILVVEDERLVALDIARCLESAGHRVVGVSSTAEEAVASMKEHDPDLALLDISLSDGVDGIQLAARMSEEWGGPVVFLTAHGDEQTVKRAQTARPAGYLVKPFKDADLLAAVTTALHRDERRSRPSSTELEIQEEGPIDTLSLDNPEARREFLGAIPVLDTLTTEELNFIAQVCEVYSFPAGEPIVIHGESELPLFIVVQGCVAVVAPQSKQSEIILTLLGPRDVFGLCGAFGDHYEATQARTFRDSVLFVVPRRLFLACLDRNPALARGLAEEISQRLRDAQDFACSLVSDNAETRVGLALRSLVPRFSRATGRSGGVAVDVSRTELAALCGLTLETVVRVLRRFEDAGVVNLAHRRFIEVLNPQLLKRYPAAG